MSKLLMCGVSAYLFFSGFVWGPASGMVVVLITFWDYFTELTCELADDAATWTRRRLRSDLHAPASPHSPLQAIETCVDQLPARVLDSAHPVTFSIFPRAQSPISFLLKGYQLLLNRPAPGASIRPFDTAPSETGAQFGQTNTCYCSLDASWQRSPRLVPAGIH